MPAAMHEPDMLMRTVARRTTASPVLSRCAAPALDESRDPRQAAVKLAVEILLDRTSCGDRVHPLAVCAEPRIACAHSALWVKDKRTRGGRGSDHCPGVVIEGDQVRIGEDANTTVLKNAEWNVLVDLIQSGQLGRL